MCIKCLNKRHDFATINYFISIVIFEYKLLFPAKKHGKEIVREISYLTFSNRWLTVSRKPA